MTTTHYSRPLPTPPSILLENTSAPSKPVITSNNAPGLMSSADIYANTSSYLDSYPYSATSFAPIPSTNPYESVVTALPGGTLIHKGFYDLLALVPTTSSASKLLWGNNKKEDIVAGPRYENIDSSPPAKSNNYAGPSLSPILAKKGRKVNKDMVSKPTGFMLVHHYLS